MVNRWGKIGKCSRFYFLGLKITVDNDYSHGIKRHLLLGRKAMTNLESILKSRDITLLTKIHLIKATAFPVVRYRCESWTIKKAECRTTDDFKLWCWKDTILKEISPGCSLEGRKLKLKLQYFGHPMQRADAFEKTLMMGKTEGWRRGRQRMRWLDGITD